MNRRNFLATMLAFGVAPAVVRASSIMRVRPTLTGWVPVHEWWEVTVTSNPFYSGELGVSKASQFETDMLRALFNASAWADWQDEICRWDNAEHILKVVGER